MDGASAVLAARSGQRKGIARRFLEKGCDGLLDEPRTGAPRTVADEDVERVITQTLETMPHGAIHWSTRSMAKASGLSSATVDEASVATCACANRSLALSVARHKAMFFSENAASARIDYGAAVCGGLRLLPAGAALAVVTDDYARMLADGMLLGDAEPIAALMERCATIGTRANAAGSKSR